MFDVEVRRKGLDIGVVQLDQVRNTVFHHSKSPRHLEVQLLVYWSRAGVLSSYVGVRLGFAHLTPLP